MLNNNLNTNEVKDSAGLEVEFQHLRYPTPQSREFSKVGELYNLPHRLIVSHQEVGANLLRRRRSMYQVRKSVVGVSGATVVIVSTHSIDIPVGDLNSNDEVENVMAEGGSFGFLDGTGTTFLFAGTGLGCVALKDGSL